MPFFRESPNQLLPREKMTQFGPGSLSDSELLAIFLSSGVVGRNVIDLSADLISKYGGLTELSRMPVAEFANNHGIGIAKAAKLAAAFEIGSRIARENLLRVPLDTPEAIYTHFSHQLAMLPTETAIVVTVNKALLHTSTTTISNGSIDYTSAHPREILRPVITRNAYGFILLHNHPSGDPSASSADRQITKNIADAAAIMQVQFIDHIIIGRPHAGREAFFSFRSEGLLIS